MPAEFTLYQNFTDIETAEDIAKELRNTGIECHLENNNHAYLTVVGYKPVELAIGLNIRSTDFTKADEVMEKYYTVELDKADKEHYIFSFQR